jgi:hypothetical protein
MGFHRELQSDILARTRLSLPSKTSMHGHCVCPRLFLTTTADQSTGLPDAGFGQTAEHAGVSGAAILSSLSKRSFRRGVPACVRQFPLAKARWSCGRRSLSFDGLQSQRGALSERR